MNYEPKTPNPEHLFLDEVPLSVDELLLAEYNSTDPVFCISCPMPAEIRTDDGREYCGACCHENYILRGAEDFRARKIGTVELLRLDVVEMDAEIRECEELAQEIAA
jgi:hypothetical protein